MEQYIDLHTHSTCSDGTFTPTELIRAAQQLGLRAVALTDHDCIDGLDEARLAGEKYGVEVVSGIEFSVYENCELHILGLDFDPAAPHMTALFDEILENRRSRNVATIKKLREVGVAITTEDVDVFSTSPITGRSQIARAMVHKGYVSCVKEAFLGYLSLGGKAYVPRKTPDAERIIAAIKADSGKAILAHLNQIKLPTDELPSLLRRLKAEGLDGIEGYYSEYTDDMGESYRAIAESLGLRLSGGSDFHGDNKPKNRLGRGFGNLKIPYSLLDELRK